MRALITTLALATLSGCGTCIGVSCPDFETATPATRDATVTVIGPQDDTGASDAVEPYADETATFTYTGSEAVLTYADADGNVWEVRYNTTPMDPGA